MSSKYSPLSQPRLDVLRWMAEACPLRLWEGDRHKLISRSLANRNLVAIYRGRGRWSADILPGGVYYLAHGDFDPATKHRERALVPATAAKLPKAAALRLRVSQMSAVDEPLPPLDGIDFDEPADRHLPTPDAAVRAMRQTARKHRRPVRVVSYPLERAMRYTVMVTRVQVAERSVHAADEESAAQKVQEEFDRPYGYFGSWKTVSSEVEVTEKEPVLSVAPGPLSRDGALLLSLKDAGKALGLSYATVYELVNKGDLEHVGIGTRKYVAREALLQFIEHNTYRGYHR